MPTLRLLAAGATVAAAATAVAGAVAGEPRAYPAAAVLALLGLLAWSRPLGSRGNRFDRGRRARGERSRSAGRRRHERARDGPDEDPARGPTSGMSEAEAYRHLGLDPGASQREVRRAYLRRVKEVHPDRGGDEATFKRVRDAYERLSG